MFQITLTPASPGVPGEGVEPRIAETRRHTASSRQRCEALSVLTRSRYLLLQRQPS
jgi:hypothetical protein